MPMPEIDKVVGERTTYKPFVGRVTAHSEYNKPGGKQRFAIEGADDFWALDNGVLDSHPELGPLPPIGTVAMWTLQKAPVRGQFEDPKKPKFYRDVIKVERVPDSYVAPKVEPTPAHKDDLPAYTETEQAKSRYDQSEHDRRVSIEQQVVLKADAEVLAAILSGSIPLKPKSTKSEEQKVEFRIEIIDRIIDRYMALADHMARLPRVLPPPAPGTDDLPWDEEPKK